MPPPKHNANSGKAAANDTASSEKATKKGGKEVPAKKDTSGKAGYSRVKCRHIMCEKLGKIMQALEKLNEGKSFPDVAREFSEDKARTGGELGWKIKGDMVPPFEEAAFALPIGGTTTEPVRTVFGYHLIHVEDKS